METSIISERGGKGSWPRPLSGLILWTEKPPVSLMFRSRPFQAGDTITGYKFLIITVHAKNLHTELSVKNKGGVSRKKKKMELVSGDCHT